MNSEDKSANRVSAWRLALTLGFVWGPGLGLLGAVTIYTEIYGHRFVEVFGSIYWGYDSTWLGALVGTGWGFLDAFTGTLIAAWIYRRLSGCAKSELSAQTPQG